MCLNIAQKLERIHHSHRKRGVPGAMREERGADAATECCIRGRRRKVLFNASKRGRTCLHIAQKLERLHHHRRKRSVPGAIRGERRRRCHRVSCRYTAREPIRRHNRERNNHRQRARNASKVQIVHRVEHGRCEHRAEHTPGRHAQRQQRHGLHEALRRVAVRACQQREEGERAAERESERRDVCGERHGGVSDRPQEGARGQQQGARAEHPTWI